MHTTPNLQCRLGRRLASIAPALPAVLALGALATPIGSLAQVPTFNSAIVTATGSAPWQPPRPAAVGDFNGDGKLDALTVDGSASARFLQGHGNSSFSRFDVNADQMTTSNMVNLPAHLAQYLPKAIGGYVLVKAGDVNGDGKLDAICVTTVHINFAPYSLVTVLTNTGTNGSGVPQFATTNYFLGFYDVRSLTVGDLSADGRPDVIVGSAHGILHIYRNNGNGTFTRTQVTNIIPIAGNPAVGPGVITDLNGDGKADFVVTSAQANATDVFLGNGDGTLQAPTIVSQAAFSIAAADLNNDGKPDLLQGLYTGSVAVYPGNGNGTFGSPTSFSSGASSGPNGIFVTDVNGDGNLDVALSLPSIAKVAILTGDGTGALGSPNLYGNIPAVQDVTLADFTGDGKPEIASISANGYGGQNFYVLTNTTPSGPPPATPPVIFTRSTASAEGWKKYTVNFIPTQTGTYTLGFALTAGGPSGDNSILIDAVKITSGATTVFSDGFETPALGTNQAVSANGGAATFGSWACTNYSGILNGSPPNWGLAAQGLGSADGTSQYAYLQAVFGNLSKIKAVNTLSLVAGQTYTVSFYQASRRDFGGQVTYNVTIDFVPSDATPPVISSPGNLIREATSAAGAVVHFTATATDNVDGPVAVVASPASGSTFPIATTAVGLAASDAAGNTATASFDITVRDSTAPVVSVPANITVEATSAAGAAVSYPAPTATDAVGVTSLTSSPASGSTFALGATTVNVAAKDAAGNTGTGSFSVTVSDTTAPVVASATPSTATLWPPNHQMVAVTLNVVASDAVGVTGYRVTATSSEPDNGLGDGDTANDIQISGSGTLNPVVNLRAERAGNGNGRTYTIAVAAFDAAGNMSAPKTCTVSVPKSRGGK